MFNYGIFDANVSACKESLLTLSINERAKITDALHGWWVVWKWEWKAVFMSRRQYSVVLNIRLQYCAWRNNPFEIFELSNFALQRHDDIMFDKYTQYTALSTATTTTMTTISALISISFSNRSIIIIIVNWYHCCCAPEQLKLESPPTTLFMLTGTWKLQGINLCNICELKLNRQKTSDKKANDV